jgi:hypothetical protein
MMVRTRENGLKLMIARHHRPSEHKHPQLNDFGCKSCRPVCGVSGVQGTSEPRRTWWQSLFVKNLLGRPLVIRVSAKYETRMCFLTVFNLGFMKWPKGTQPLANTLFD